MIILCKLRKLLTNLNCFDLANLLKTLIGCQMKTTLYQSVEILRSFLASARRVDYFAEKVRINLLMITNSHVNH